MHGRHVHGMHVPITLLALSAWIHIAVLLHNLLIIPIIWFTSIGMLDTLTIPCGFFANLAHCLWTLSSLSTSRLRTGSQLAPQVSIGDLTREVYAISLCLYGLPLRFLLTKPSLWWTFAFAMLACRDGDVIQRQHFCHHGDTICHPKSSYVAIKLHGTSTCGCNNIAIFSDRAIFMFPTVGVGLRRPC